MLCLSLGGFILSVYFDLFAVVDCEAVFRMRMIQMLLSLLSYFIPLIRSSCNIFSINYIKI